MDLTLGHNVYCIHLDARHRNALLQLFSGDVHCIELAVEPLKIFLHKLPQGGKLVMDCQRIGLDYSGEEFFGNSNDEQAQGHPEHAFLAIQNFAQVV